MLNPYWTTLYSRRLRTEPPAGGRGGRGFAEMPPQPLVNKGFRGYPVTRGAPTMRGLKLTVQLFRTVKSQLLEVPRR